MFIFLMFVCLILNQHTCKNKTISPIIENSIQPKQQKIPNFIFQTNEYSEIPKNMKKSMKSWINKNPSYVHVYFTGPECGKFIKEKMPERVSKAYDSLVPGAYKSDLWRYCVLFIYGGVYIDSSNIDVIGLDEIIHSSDSFVTAIDGGQQASIYNAFMASTPQNPILKEVINLCVQRIEERDYGINSLYITGPRCLGDALNNFLESPWGTDFNEGVLSFKGEIINLYQRTTPKTDFIDLVMGLEKDGIIYSKGRPLVFTKYSGHNIEGTCWRQQERYDEIYERRGVFK